MTNAAVFVLSATMIEDLINRGYIQIEGLTGEAIVRRMFLRETSGVVGAVHIVVEGEGLYKTSPNGELPYAESGISNVCSIASIDASCSTLMPCISDFYQQMKESAARLLSQNIFSIQIGETSTNQCSEQENFKPAPRQAHATDDRLTKPL